jgi:hypothetical protein
MKGESSMKSIKAWMMKADNLLTVGLCAMSLAVGVFLWAHSQHHNANCDGCNWFWCHRYTGGGSI